VIEVEESPYMTTRTGSLPVEEFVNRNDGYSNGADTSLDILKIFAEL
jgi:hypothetical protein